MQNTTTVVLSALREKFFDPTCPHRIWIIGGSGSLNGAYLAGVQVALVEAGLHHVFDGALGVSTGIPALGYLLASDGSATRHWYETTTYSVEARSRKFLKWNGRMDIPWLLTVFKGVTGKPICYKRVRDSGVRFVGVVTDWETGQAHYIEPQFEEEFFALIGAGCSVPVATPPLMLRDRLMTDGAVSDPCPVPWLMSLPEPDRPTHILVVANAWRDTPSRFRQHYERKLLRWIFGRRVPQHILDGFAQRHQHFSDGIEEAILRTDVTVAVEWLPWQQSPLERNPKMIEALTRAGYERFWALLKEGDS